MTLKSVFIFVAGASTAVIGYGLMQQHVDAGRICDDIDKSVVAPAPIMPPVLPAGCETRERTGTFTCS